MAEFPSTIASPRVSRRSGPLVPQPFGFTKRKIPPNCPATLCRSTQDRPNGMCASGGPGAVLVWP